MLKKSPGYLFNIYLDRQWKFISTFRHFVSDIIYNLTGDYNKSKSLEIGISELIDNALRYSIEDSDIHVTAKKSKNHVTFNISNYPLEKKPGQAYNRIREQIELLGEMKPVDAYIYCLTHYDKEKKLHLGFARMRYESNMKISVKKDESNMITIEAVYELK